MNKFELKDVVELWPNRDENSYKGTFGKVGIIAGSIHMPGASVLCTKAAVRSGAGLTTANIPIENFSILGVHVPEAMLYNREDNLEDYLKTLIQKFKGILVIDADGLTHVKPLLKYIRERTAPTIITPHFGEMARILDVNIQEVINHQKEVAKRFAKENNVYVVLKGSETVVSSPTSTTVLDRGNTGLSKGGSGDVLAGMILGFSNRYKNLTDAIHSAVFMHGYTAEYVSKFKAVEAMTAMDIVNYLGESMLHVKK